MFEQGGLGPGLGREVEGWWLHRQAQPVSVGWPLVPQPGSGRRLGARQQQRTGLVVFYEQMFQLFNYQTVMLLVYCSQNRVQIVKGKKWQLLQLWTGVSSLHVCLPQRSWTTLDRITTGSQA